MKDKTIKFRLSEESASTLEKLAKELGKSKSEIIRSGLPEKISSAAFDDLLSIQISGAWHPHNSIQFTKMHDVVEQ